MILEEFYILVLLAGLYEFSFDFFSGDVSGMKYAFWAITLVAAIASAIGAILISDWRPRRWKKALKSTVTGMAIRQ